MLMPRSVGGRSHVPLYHLAQGSRRAKPYFEVEDETVAQAGPREASPQSYEGYEKIFAVKQEGRLGWVPGVGELSEGSGSGEFGNPAHL